MVLHHFCNIIIYLIHISYSLVCMYKQKFTSIPLVSHYCLLAFRSVCQLLSFSWKTYKFKTHMIPFNFATNFRVRLACGHGDVGTCPHQVCCSHLNPISTKGADYAHPILMSPLSFESHRCAWEWTFVHRWPIVWILFYTVHLFT